MAEECTHDCSSCSLNCPSKNGGIPKDEPNKKSNVKHIIAVMSGKGGVGKSLVTSMLAVDLNRKGYKVGILDADITGPSIPKAFGMHDDVDGDGEGNMLPPETATGIKILSVNLMLDDESHPVVWRGSIISGTVRQFWTDAAWGDLDYLLIDCPPGTGDVPLTVFQSIPVDGIVIEGHAAVDESALTGESIPVDKEAGDNVIAATTNLSGFIKCQATLSRKACGSIW